MPDMCEVQHLMAASTSSLFGQPRSSCPRACITADRLRLNLTEAPSGLTRPKRAAGLRACASDPPREDSLRLICPCSSEKYPLGGWAKPRNTLPPPCACCVHEKDPPALIAINESGALHMNPEQGFSILTGLHKSRVRVTSCSPISHGKLWQQVAPYEVLQICLQAWRSSRRAGMRYSVTSRHASGISARDSSMFRHRCGRLSCTCSVNLSCPDVLDQKTCSMHCVLGEQ